MDREQAIEQFARAQIESEKERAAFYESMARKNDKEPWLERHAEGVMAVIALSMAKLGLKILDSLECFPKIEEARERVDTLTESDATLSEFTARECVCRVGGE